VNNNIIISTVQTQVKPKTEENKDKKAEEDEARKALRAQII